LTLSLDNFAITWTRALPAASLLYATADLTKDYQNAICKVNSLYILVVEVILTVLHVNNNKETIVK
jgi:hypothetical protein